MAWPGCQIVFACIIFAMVQNCLVYSSCSLIIGLCVGCVCVRQNCHDFSVVGQNVNICQIWFHMSSQHIAHPSVMCISLYFYLKFVAH